MAGETEFVFLMEEHGPAVRSAIRAVLGRSPDEDDLAQEVFTRLLVRMRQPGAVEAGPWCRRAARNLAIDHIRKKSATPTGLGDLERAYGEGLDHEVVGREVAGYLAGVLSRLPDQHRRVLLAQLEGGATHAAIGAELGLSPKATESLLARARRRLRMELRRVGMEAGAGATGVAPLAGIRTPAARSTAW